MSTLDAITRDALRDDFKTFAGITSSSDDALIADLVTRAFEALETNLCRGILSAAYSELVYPEGGVLTLLNPVVSSVQFVSGGRSQAASIRYTGADERARLEVTAGGVVLSSESGSLTTVTKDFDTSTTMASLKTEVDSVAGWEMIVYQAGPSKYLVRRSPVDAKDRYITLDTWDDCDGDYHTDYAAGQVTLPYGGGCGPESRVDYTAGYTTLPLDLEQVVVAIVKGAYDARQRDGSLESERLGDYQYKAGGEGFEAVAAAAFSQYDDVLSRYRRHTV